MTKRYTAIMRTYAMSEIRDGHPLSLDACVTEVKKRLRLTAAERRGLIAAALRHYARGVLGSFKFQGERAVYAITPGYFKSLGDMTLAELKLVVARLRQLRKDVQVRERSLGEWAEEFEAAHMPKNATLGDYLDRAA